MRRESCSEGESGSSTVRLKAEVNVSELLQNTEIRSQNCCCTCTRVTELTGVQMCGLVADVQMCGLVADGIVEHTAVGVFILIFHLQR